MAKKIKFNTPESLVYVGLDCETSSDNFLSGKPISVGLTIFKEGILKEFSSLVAHDPSLDWSQEAENIHKIKALDLINAPLPSSVDETIFNWLNSELDFPSQNSLIAVGWNVNSFDFHFLKPQLPKSMSLFSRRVVELNSLIFLYSQTSLVNYRTFDELKENIKVEGRETLNSYAVKGREHEAGYDAALGLAIYSNLKEYIR